MAEEEHFLIMRNETPETEKESKKWKEKNKNNIKQDESSKININTAATLLLKHKPSQFAIENIKKDALIRIEQDEDKILRNMKEEIQKQPLDKHL